MGSGQNKTLENNADVYAFLESVEDPKRKEDARTILEVMQTLVPEPPKMWGSSIVGFGRYQYRYESGRKGDFFKVGFSPRKQNLTLYIMPGFERFDDTLSALGKYTTGKSCLYIKRLEDVDLDVLKVLIEKSYQYMTNKYG